MDKAALVAAGSSIAASCVIYNVWQQKQQFYPTVVHISKSSSCMAVLYVQAFSLVILFGHIFRKIFFGSLRAAETEHLVERSWYALTETCLAFTVFRDNLSPSFVAQFTVLLFLKAFHWLLEDRIDYMERSPVIRIFFHIRALSLISILVVCDGLLLSYAAHVTLQQGASVHLVFGFEYVVLLLLVGTIVVKYILHLVDLRHENQWPNKTVYLLYTELIIGAVKVLMYAMFVTVMIRVHTFPLFVIRPMYLALRQFQKTLIDVIKSRKATYNMRERYPDATPEEISSGDNTCIICREEMTTAKKLPCGHIFHLECLRSWLLRQQTCPTCRIDILQQQQQQQQRQQQQQQQQQQQPRPPNNMNNINPPPGFPAVPPPIFSYDNNNNNTPNTPNSHPFISGPIFIPPAGGTQQPFNIAGFRMPPPPPSLSNLTEEELKSFEGQTREAIENRLVILRNVQMLMEAVQGQMQLYNSVAGPTPTATFIPPGPSTPGTSPTVPPAPCPSPQATAVPLPATAVPSQATAGPPQDTAGPSQATAGPSQATKRSKPIEIKIDGVVVKFESKQAYEDEVERRRDYLLREYNLIGDEDYVACEQVRAQLRANRIAVLEKPVGSATTTPPSVHLQSVEEVVGASAVVSPSEVKTEVEEEEEGLRKRNVPQTE